MIHQNTKHSPIKNFTSALAGPSYWHGAGVWLIHHHHQAVSLYFLFFLFFPSDIRPPVPLRALSRRCAGGDKPNPPIIPPWGMKPKKNPALLLLSLAHCAPQQARRRDLKPAVVLRGPTRGQRAPRHTSTFDTADPGREAADANPRVSILGGDFGDGVEEDDGDLCASSSRAARRWSTEDPARCGSHGSKNSCDANLRIVGEAAGHPGRREDAARR